MLHARPAIPALLGAFLLWCILGCSGLTQVDRQPQLASIPVEPGVPFDLRFEANGAPMKVWLRYDVANKGHGYTLHGQVQHKVGREPRYSSNVTIDEEGVHHGPYTRSESTGGVGTGRSVNARAFLGSPAEPPGTPVRIVGTFTPGPHTTVKQATLVVTN